MRIIGGEFRSRVLASFDGENVRPTSDRAREALFNILANKVRGARVLDVFAGSGALGIESLSRGAKEVLFNDLSKDSVAIVKRNLTALNLQVNGEKAKVYQGDFSTLLQTVQGKFDLILLDPPYAQEFGLRALEIIAQRELLTDDGVAVYERDCSFVGQIDGLEKYDERKYGKAILTFFRKEKIEQ